MLQSLRNLVSKKGQAIPEYTLLVTGVGLIGFTGMIAFGANVVAFFGLLSEVVSPDVTLTVESYTYLASVTVPEFVDPQILTAAEFTDLLSGT